MRVGICAIACSRDGATECSTFWTAIQAASWCSIALVNTQQYIKDKKTERVFVPTQPQPTQARTRARVNLFNVCQQMFSIAALLKPAPAPPLPPVPPPTTQNKIDCNSNQAPYQDVNHYTNRIQAYTKTPQDQAAAQPQLWPYYIFY